MVAIPVELLDIDKSVGTITLPALPVPGARLIMNDKTYTVTHKSFTWQFDSRGVLKFVAIDVTDNVSLTR